METQKRQGWRIKDWCAPDVKIISQALLFKLWREGKGPMRVRVGGATVITESHGEYLSPHRARTVGGRVIDDPRSNEPGKRGGRCRVRETS